MTTRSGNRKPKPKTAQTDNSAVTVDVVPPHAVYHDGDQRTGTLHDVPAAIAEQWIRHGFARTAGASDDT